MLRMSGLGQSRLGYAEKAERRALSHKDRSRNKLI
jgi:hypothetical protein